MGKMRREPGSYRVLLVLRGKASIIQRYDMGIGFVQNSSSFLMARCRPIRRQAGPRVPFPKYTPCLRHLFWEYSKTKSYFEFGVLGKPILPVFTGIKSKA